MPAGSRRDRVYCNNKCSALASYYRRKTGAAGHRNAWNEIVERYAPLIWSICRRHGLGSADAADVAQAVWLHLVDQLDHLRDPGALPGWLATTTVRECLRRLTGRGPERLDTRLADSPPPAAGVVIDEQILAGRHMALRAAFAELPPRCQQLLSSGRLIIRQELHRHVRKGTPDPPVTS